MENNQYIWLHSNLDKYQYNTDEAKQLYDEYKSITFSAEVQPSDDVMSKLVNCYDRFTRLFNNNPFNYKSGIKEYAIETGDSDCYFVKSNGNLVPVGYYKLKHQVECVLLLNEKIENQKKSTIDDKSRLVETFKDEAQTVTSEYEKFKKVKKANYFRASVCAIASIFIIIYTVSFFKITDIFHILKSVGDSNAFSDSVIRGMSYMPILSGSGIVGWFSMLLIHIALLIFVFINIKNIKNEYVLAYQKNVTTKVNKKTEKNIKIINDQFDSNLENDTQMLLTLARQGTTVTFEKGMLARIIRKTRIGLKTADEYTDKEIDAVRGIKRTRTVLIFILIACLGYFSYTLMGNQQFAVNLEIKCFDMRKEFDNLFLRSKKMVQITSHNCPVYSSASKNAKINYYLPEMVQVELTEKKEIGEETWSKIKLVTDTNIISDWVPTIFTVPYNEVDYDSFDEIPIINSDCSSYLVGQNTEYVPELAYDGNKKTSWQDGNVNDSGEGEYITLNFEGTETVDMIQIFPGNSKREELFWENERIKKAKLKFSNGKSVTYEFDDVYDESFQTIWLNKPVETDYVKIEIISVYGGDKYTDLCISEIHAYTLNKNE